MIRYSIYIVDDVRELKNLIEGSVLVGKGKELTLPDLGIGGSGREPMLKQKGCEPGFPLFFLKAWTSLPSWSPLKNTI